jgi:hypothetical protein
MPGDPLTPGWPSVPGAEHVPMEQAVSVPKIIAVPLSWRDAKPLLENMDGPEAPKDWQGGLPIKYRLGGNAMRVHLKVDMDTSLKPNYVVEGRIRGAQFPDEWIVMGNHRDAWEFGGVDPSSGTASMNEAVSRALATGQIDREVAARINRKLMAVESSWLNPEGIPGRLWFKHVLYAARYTYAHLELPGLTEAIERDDWKVATEQARILEQALAKNAALLREAGAELQGVR